MQDAAMKTFRPYQPDQMLLMPPSIEEWLPAGHLARFVREVVSELDLRAIEDRYEDGPGQPPYHPRLMVTLLLYAYSTGTYSSRRMAAKLVDDVAYRYLAAGNTPDFRTLSDFRKLHGAALNGLFVQVLKLCAAAGLVKLGRVAGEGKEAENGRRFGGRGFLVPDPETAKPAPRAQRNFTDPESRIQKTPDGFIQGYTAVLAVDETAQVIVAQHVTPRGPEVQELASAVDMIERLLGERPDQVVADAGYWSEQNVERLEAKGIDPYVARGRMKHGEPAMPPPRGRIPAKLSVAERMQRKLRTKAGHAAYARRKVIVEPVNGQIKQARGFRQFLRRGVERVGQEWSLVCTAHNLLKLRAAWVPA